tara:strand:- start:184 stop:471 length:288 start_codon:yes stop_codon:yes gene_type:complete
MSDKVTSLQMRVIKLEKCIAELEKTLRKFEKSVRNENELLEMQKNQDVRDLEQQAKGIEDALECFQSSYEDTKVYVSDLTSRIQKLRKQAKGGAV